jgi:hypothetical protein
MPADPGLKPLQGDSRFTSLLAYADAHAPVKSAQ